MRNIHKKAFRNGLVAAAILLLLVVLGSRKLQYYDAALIPYLFGVFFAVLGTVYRYSVWLERPPTQKLWKRSFSYFFHRNFFQRLWAIFGVFVRQLLLQHFIERRSFYRWLMHFSIAWGCILAFMVTFPLVFGWIHFATASGQSETYQLYTFGFPQITFAPDGLLAFLFFNSLNLSSLLVCLGTLMAFTRRILHPELVAGQNFMNDFLPLLILFAVSITGLFLTYSSRFLGGEHFRTLSTLHCFTVVVFLVYLPFGKFFHIFQRGALLGAAIYISEKKSDRLSQCQKCGDAYVSLMQKGDVQKSLKEMGFRYGSQGSIQDLCPLCRRRLFMWSQHQRLAGQFHLKKENQNG